MLAERTNPPADFDEQAETNWTWADIFLLFARNCGWDKDTVLDMTPAQVKLYLNAADREVKRDDAQEWKRKVFSGEAFSTAKGAAKLPKEGVSLGGQPIA